ncbi:unnamed protein product [Didymodactylos carnosus]|uniref:WAP domain-containing protein n=1 Tax=Didymodactylos carnosus TaxID=1234261 RepID=A0A814WMC8_9BILA|nr:unnamed protein product [Didymodactylos carnosus]CAF1207524.1 unnamed protein product [Didymodactylos carnosus]CAF3971713.1 unnamed protein product [Didymodactylos carnosus]CAF4016479.1 unnamed protein product [Didymodactylos carnosus]
MHSVILVLCIAFLIGLHAKTVVDLEANGNVKHPGQCPPHLMQCAVFCPPDGNFGQTGCKYNDGNCLRHQKCCRPACGCSPQCVNATKIKPPTINVD